MSLPTLNPPLTPQQHAALKKAFAKLLNPLGPLLLFSHDSSGNLVVSPGNDPSTYLTAQETADFHSGLAAICNFEPAPSPPPDR